MQMISAAATERVEGTTRQALQNKSERKKRDGETRKRYISQITSSALFLPIKILGTVGCLAAVKLPNMCSTAFTTVFITPVKVQSDLAKAETGCEKRTHLLHPQEALIYFHTAQTQTHTHTRTQTHTRKHTYKSYKYTHTNTRKQTYGSIRKHITNTGKHIVL